MATALPLEGPWAVVVQVVLAVGAIIMGLGQVYYYFFGHPGQEQSDPQGQGKATTRRPSPMQVLVRLLTALGLVAAMALLYSNGCSGPDVPRFPAQGAYQTVPSTNGMKYGAVVDEDHVAKIKILDILQEEDKQLLYEFKGVALEGKDCKFKCTSCPVQDSTWLHGTVTNGVLDAYLKSDTTRASKHHLMEFNYLSVPRDK